ncbi:Arylesterase precursor [compost metagenome]
MKIEKKRIEGSKVVMFGDSITFGQGVPDEHRWVNQVTRRFNLDSINAGIGGNTSTQGLERLQHDVIAHHPDFVIINFGMNDHVMTESDTPKVALATFRNNLSVMIDEIRRHGAIPILVTTNYMIEGESTLYYYRRHPEGYYANVGGAEAWLGKYVQAVREVGSLKQVDVVDVHKVCANYDKYEFLRSLHNEANTDDGVHPWIMGSDVYAREIGDYLAALYS